MRNGIKWLLNLWGVEKSKDIQKAWQFVFNKNESEVKLVLKDLSIYCNVYRSSFVSSDAYQTAFNEGSRDVFLHIIEMISLDLQELSNY